MTIDDKFDEWFEKNFPESSFGNLAGAFRLAMKTDIAKKAFIFGLKLGLDSGFDQKLQDQLMYYLTTKEIRDQVDKIMDN